MEPAGKPRIRVAAGILENRRGEVLISQRPDGGHMAGHWEFPGGKIEADESDREGLVRELAEELAVTVTEARPLLELEHEYPDRLVTLSVWRVTEFSGEPSGHEGQPLRWIDVRLLPGCEGFLPADRPIVDALIDERGGSDQHSRSSNGTS